MKLRNLTLTGFLLISAAAIIKAGEHASETKEQGNDNGRLIPFSNTGGSPVNILSCTIASAMLECTKTTATITSEILELIESYVGAALNYQTVGNTSDTRAVQGDQTSNVQPDDNMVQKQMN